MRYKPELEQNEVRENWQQVREIFDGALHLKREERTEFVARQASGNKSLQDEVESLLSSHDSAGVFLESPAVGEVAESLVTEVPKLKDGEFLKHYKIIRKIGAGGMGEVYLAEDTQLERNVAIKILNESFDTGQSNLQRFFREAKAASGLDHPNIMIVHEIGEFDGTHYIVSEFIKGKMLNDARLRTNLSLIQIVDIGIQVVGALAAAHKVGVIHRDIKPENIMVRDDGHVKILDFGLVKISSHGQSEIDFDARTQELVNTREGVILGTASYMSPEQARGRGVDSRTDIWSFGVVFFQMLTNALPFSGDTTSDIIASILRNEPPRLARFVADIPDEIEDIVRKSLRKSTDDRYQTADDMAEDLKAVRRKLEFAGKTEPLKFRVSDEFDKKAQTDPNFTDVTANRSVVNSGLISSFISGMVTETKAHPQVAALSLVIVVGIFLFSYLGISRFMAPVPPADSFQKMRLTKLTFEGIASNVVSLSPDGKYIAYALSEDGKESLVARQIATSAVIQLIAPDNVRYRGLTFSPDSDRIYYNVSEFDQARELREIPVLGGNSRVIVKDIDGSVSFSPDGNKMAFIRSQTSLVVSDLNGSAQKDLASAESGETFDLLTWNPDGKSIVSSSFSLNDGKFHIDEVDLKDGTKRRLSTTPWLRINGLKFLPDSGGILISGRDTDTQYSQIWKIDFQSGKPLRITNDFSNYVDLSLTADGKSLVAVKQERLFNIWNVPNTNPGDAKKITLEEGRDEGTSGIASTADGKIVYSVRKTGTPDLWLIGADGSENKQLTFDQGMNYFPTISPDGRSIVFVSDRAGDPNIWQMGFDGTNAVALTNSADGESYPSFTPDGIWLVYQRTGADFIPTIWKVNINDGIPIQLTETEANRPIISPDGKFIACEYGKEEPDRPAKLAVIPIEGGAPLKTLYLPNVLESRVFRWTKDGKALVYVDDRDRVDNLWSQTLDDSPPRQLTFFVSGRIASFDLAKSGDGFVLSRGSESSDVIMMSDFR